MSSRETYLRTGLRSLGRSRSSLLCFNDTRGEASAAVATFIHVALRQMLRPYGRPRPDVTKTKFCGILYIRTVAIHPPRRVDG